MFVPGCPDAGPANPPAALWTACGACGDLEGASRAADDWPLAAGLIRRALHAGDLDRARRMLPALCGRDPAHLDVTGIARAVVQSVAVNSSDAIVAPLLWGALAGPAGLAG